MSTDQASVPTSDRRIALLIDAENVSHTRIAGILAELSKHGIANIRRAYGDWGSSGLKGWKDKLHAFAIRPIQQFTYSTGKNASDIALVIDAMELLYTQDLDAFCVASSDADFTPLVMHLKANGHDVFGFGDRRKTPEPFVNACTTFLYFDSLVDPEVPAAPAAPLQKAKSASKAAAKPEPTVDPAKPLAEDAALVTALRGGVEATAREDGWALVATAGNAVKRQGPIDPRNYGKKSFTALFEATGLFEIVKAANGQPWVADKRNKDRASRPAS